MIVYVDDKGNPLSTVTEGAPASTPVPSEAAYTPPAAETTPSSEAPAYTPAPSSEAPASSAPAATSEAPVYSSPAPVETPSSSSAAAAPSASSGSSDGSFPLGISYSPYIVGGCKDAAAVLADFQKFTGYGAVRLYGVDCDQVASGVAAAKATGKKLILGIYYLTDVATDVQTIATAVGGDWSLVSLVTIGNEDVNRGTSVDTVLGALSVGRSALRAAGYTGPISTVDTFDKIIANPSLCKASDIATANCHAFFTSSISASGAGAYVKEQEEAVKKACGGKQTLITESGWPKAGDTNGDAVPSLENQATAIGTLKSSFSDSNIVLFSAFDDAWKQDGAGTFNAEKFWGILS